MAKVKDSAQLSKGRFYILCPELNFCYAIMDSRAEAKAFVEEEWLRENDGGPFKGFHRGEICTGPEYVQRFDKAPPYDPNEEV